MPVAAAPLAVITSLLGTTIDAAPIGANSTGADSWVPTTEVVKSRCRGTAQHPRNDPPPLEGLPVVPHGAALARATSNVDPRRTRHGLFRTTLQGGRVGGNGGHVATRSGSKDCRLTYPAGAARGLDTFCLGCHRDRSPSTGGFGKLRNVRKFDDDRAGLARKVATGRKFDADRPAASQTPHRSEIGARFTRFTVEKSALVGNLTAANRTSASAKQPDADHDMGAELRARWQSRWHPLRTRDGSAQQDATAQMPATRPDLPRAALGCRSFGSSPQAPHARRS